MDEELEELREVLAEYEALRADFVAMEKRALIAEADLQTLREAYKNLGSRYEEEHTEVIRLREENNAALARERDLRAAVEAVRAAIDRADPPGRMRAGTPSVSVAVLRAALASPDGRAMRHRFTRHADGDCHLCGHPEAEHPAPDAVEAYQLAELAQGRIVDDISAAADLAPTPPALTETLGDLAKALRPFEAAGFTRGSVQYVVDQVFPGEDK